MVVQCRRDVEVVPLNVLQSWTVDWCVIVLVVVVGVLMASCNAWAVLDRVIRVLWKVIVVSA